jgi:phenylacetate-CoA ligase
MVVVRGVNVYPGLIEELVRSLPEITEYRVRFDFRPAMVEMGIEMETTPDCAKPAHTAALLEEAVHAALNLRVPVRPLPVGSLPRFEMKSQRWLRIPRDSADPAA